MTLVLHLILWREIPQSAMEAGNLTDLANWLANHGGAVASDSGDL